MGRSIIIVKTSAPFPLQMKVKNAELSDIVTHPDPIDIECAFNSRKGTVFSSVNTTDLTVK